MIIVLDFQKKICQPCADMFEVADFVKISANTLYQKGFVDGILEYKGWTFKKCPVPKSRRAKRIKIIEYGKSPRQ